jgi:rSAM/selenodomain-associated transferase 1
VPTLPFDDACDVALGIMCKAPVEGACKTRLCPPLTPREAAALSHGFIADVAAMMTEIARRCSVRPVAIYTPAGDKAVFQGLFPSEFALLEQRGAGLGERLLHATEDLFDGGFAGICLIGADSPTLPASVLEKAIEELRRPGDRVVLGPAIDGGYYLIGMKQVHAAMFQGVSWGRSQVLAQTLGRAAALSAPLSLLPLWYDVDDLGSLQLLMHELFGAGLPIATDGLAGSAARHSRSLLRRLLLLDDADRFGFPRQLTAD